MKNNNLYNRIYEHSFSLLLTFSFYAIIFALLLSCEDEEEVADIFWGESEQVSTADGATYSVGFDQLSENNQDSFVEKKDSEGVTLWKVAHAASPLKEKALLVTLDAEDNPWVLFMVEGESSGPNTITQKFVAPHAFKPEFLFQNEESNPKAVAVLAQLDPADGKIVKGSFLQLPVNNDVSPTLNINKIGITKEGDVLLKTEKFTWLQTAYSSLMHGVAELYDNNSFSQLPSPVCINLNDLQEKK